MIHPAYQGALYAYFVHIEKWFKHNEEKIRRQASKWLTIIPNKMRYYINNTLTFLSQKAGQQRIKAQDVNEMAESNRNVN